MTSRTFTVTNPLGLHARAAARFVHLATRFSAQIQIGREGKIARAMRALVNYERMPYKVEMREKPTPEIGDEDVLLAVRGVGVCGSDLHQWHASHSWAVNYPVTLGHEFAGVVAQVGAKVRHF